MGSAERHLCPRRGCKVDVPNTMFCCTDDWHSLSLALRAEISRTRTLSVLTPTRRLLFEQARDEWAAIAAA